MPLGQRIAVSHQPGDRRSAAIRCRSDFLEFDNWFEATENKPCAIEWHGILFHIHSFVLEIFRHHFLHGGIACFLVRPLDPGEYDRLIGRRLHRLAEIGGISLGHIIGPAFDNTRSTEIGEDSVDQSGVLDEFLFVRGRHSYHETVNVAHSYCPPTRDGEYSWSNCPVGARMLQIASGKGQ